MPRPAPPPAIRDRPSGRGPRVSRRAVAGAAIGVVVAALALIPAVRPFVDWSMDGDLTPGVWEPRRLFAGACISLIFLGTIGAPLGLLTLVVAGTVVALGGSRAPTRCPACRAALRPGSGRCPRCGPLPPRRPGVRSSAGLRHVVTTLGAIAVFAVIAVLLSSGIAWVQLEREEDAFGERARAAALSGLGEYQETNRHGSLLAWSTELGYWSHRD